MNRGYLKKRILEDEITMGTTGNTRNSVSSKKSFNLSRKEFIASAIGAAATFILPKTASAQTQENCTMTDSLGRQVSIPLEVSTVVPLGVNAQTLLTTLVPNAIASSVTNLSYDAQDYEEAGLSELLELPNIQSGALLQQKNSSAINEVEKTSPDLIVDAGIKYDGLAKRLDAIQEASGVPCIFIDISFGKLPTAYRMLGNILNVSSRAEVLAAFIENSNRKARQVGAAKTNKPVVFYAQGTEGTIVKSGIDVRLDAIKSLNITVFEDAYNFERGTVNFSKLYDRDLNLILFDDFNILTQLRSKSGSVYEEWKDVPAIAQNRYAVSPALMHSWLGSVVLVQTLGVLWLASIMWPSDCGYSIKNEAKEFYSLFYGLNKSDDEMAEIIGAYCEAGYADEEE